MVFLLIVAGTMLRVALGTTIGLSVDESYAVVMSRRLSLSYFDHPPMMFWWAGMASRLASSESGLVARLPFILAFMVTTWLLSRVGRLLFGDVAGLWTAILLNLSLFFSVAAGGWVLPDGPLLLFGAAATYCLARATIEGEGTIAASGEARAAALSGRQAWWIAFGLCSGLALLSKYHGCFLLLGAGAFLVTSRRRVVWLRRPEPYLALALSAVVFVPVLLWNARHAWVSFRFQGSRAVPLAETGGTPLIDSVAGQAAWILPWIWLPLLGLAMGALRAGPRDTRRWLLVCLGVGPILGFTLLAALGSRGLPHWEAPGYFMLLPLLGVSIARALGRGPRPTLTGCLIGGAAGFLLVVGGLLAQVHTGWLAHVAPRLVARGDPTVDLLDWGPVDRQLRAWGFPRPGMVLAAARWDDAAKLAYVMGPDVVVTCVGEDPRGFGPTGEPGTNIGKDIILVVRRRAGAEPMRAYAAFFESLRALGSVPLERGGREVVMVSVYIGRGLRRPLPLLRSL